MNIQNFIVCGRNEAVSLSFNSPAAAVRDDIVRVKFSLCLLQHGFFQVNHYYHL